MQRLKRTFLSLVWVIGACLVYTICIAPFIESDTTERDEASADSSSLLMEPTTDPFTRDLAELFPKGSWELDHPKVLRSQQATILLSDFEQQGDSLRIKKCSLVFYGENHNRHDPNQRGPIILQAPEGAILDFDQAIDLSGGMIGRPVGGKLVGNIRIFSAGGQDSEDFELTTRNVVITDQRIWTPEAVSFRLGNNDGRGRYLIIERSNSRPQAEDQASFAGLGRIELQQLDRFTVEMAGTDMFDALQGQTPSHRSSEPTEWSTVELRCDGPLHFDLHGMIATVDENVRITRAQAGQPNDTVSASKLSMRLARVPTATVDENEATKSKLAVTRVVAVGDPLTIDARSRQTFVESRRFEYDFETQRVQLKGFHPFENEAQRRVEHVRIQSPLHAVSASTIDFTGTADRTTWTMEATGPGRYVGMPTRDPSEKVSASWTNRVSLVPSPEPGQQVLTLEGAASVSAPEVGLIQSDLIRLWVRHQTVVVAHRIDGKPITETKSFPTKLVTAARSGTATRIEAPQVKGTLAALTVHLDPMTSIGTPQPRNLSRPDEPPVRRPAAQDPRQRLTQYHVEGGELTVWIDQHRELRKLAVRGQTRLTEASGQLEGTFALAGERIDYEVQADGTPTALLQGNPARFATPEMSVSGATIQLDGHQNRLKIPGPGSLRVRVPRSALSRQEPNEPSNAFASSAGGGNPSMDEGQVDLEVGWQGGLDFDGQTVDMRSKVDVRADDLNIQTSQLLVSLRESLDFSRLRGANRQPEIQSITAAGGMVAANRTRDAMGNTTGYQRMVTQDFYLDYPSGKAEAHGPGWLSTTSLGSAMSMEGLASPKANSDKESLMHLSVAFALRLDGNLHDRSCKLSDDVRTWYGPVNDWEDRVDPTERQLRGEALWMTCRELYVLESPTARTDGPRQPMELLAVGETYVESERYAAKGHQIKYAEEKGMLTLEGDAQRPAELWQRNLATGQPSHSGRARTIRFWPETRQLEIKFLGLDLSQSPQSRR